MNKRIKLLAASAVVGLQALPGYVSVAYAQTQLELVTVTGQSCSSGNVRVFEGGTFRGCTSLSNLPGGGGGGGSVPEGEAWVNGRWGFAPPPPPPRTEEQKQRDRDQCNANRTDSLNTFQVGISGEVARCGGVASSGSGWLYFVEIVNTLRGQSCGVRIAEQTVAAKAIFDAEHKQCMERADRP
jgi:hypothetical protein